MPIILGKTASKKFGASETVDMAIGAALVYPKMVASTAGDVLGTVLTYLVIGPIAAVLTSIDLKSRDKMVKDIALPSIITGFFIPGYLGIMALMRYLDPTGAHGIEVLFTGAVGMAFRLVGVASKAPEPSWRMC